MVGSQHHPSQRGLREIVNFYVTRLLDTRQLLHSPHDSKQHMKVLIVDDDTIRYVSTVMSQREILDLGVYLTEKIDKTGSSLSSDNMRGEGIPYPHMIAVYFVRPTKSNIAMIRRELREPRFGKYLLYFSNIVSDMRLQDIAEADVHGAVVEVKEAFGDFVALDPHHFYIPITQTYMALAPMNLDFGASSDMVDRITEGIASVMLSYRQRFMIRFQAASEVAGRVASSLHQLTQQDQRELFDFGSRDGQYPILLLLDRKQDPVTPLLSQWTYQAMIHQVLGIRDNIVQLPPDALATPRHDGASTDEFVVSSAQDSFFKKNMYANFGDVGMAIKNLVDQVSTDHKTAKGFDSINDIAEFVEHLPETTQQQGMTAKHVSIMSALSREVEERSLMTVSGIEQDISCQASSPVGHYEAVSLLLRNPSIAPSDKAKLVLLYALRYDDEAPQQTSSLFGAIEGICDGILLDTMRYIRKTWSTQGKTLDLFSDKTLSSRFASLAKQHLKGVENVYTQHKPAFMSVLEKVAKGRLPTTEYPFVKETEAAKAQTKGSRLIIAFIIGGSTYEEAKSVWEMNSGSSEHSVPGVHVILGSTGVQSSDSFMQDLSEVRRLEMYKTSRR